MRERAQAARAKPPRPARRGPVTGRDVRETMGNQRLDRASRSVAASRPAAAWRRAGAVVALAAMSLAASVPGASEGQGSDAPWPDRIPARPADARTGSRFAEDTKDHSGRERQEAAIFEITRGNIPDFLRALKPVRIEGRLADGRDATATIWVMPDYLAIGSNEDFLRIPLTMPSATTVANAFGFSLPTRKIVDAIHAQSDFRFEPIPMPPGPKMRSSEYYLRHQRLTEEQRAGRPLGELVAGHKKDVVLTTRLRRYLDRIAIYGWQRRDGEPIQPLSKVHGENYADYSHGIRLVWATVWIDGAAHPFYDVLKDPNLAPLLTHETAFRKPRLLMRLIGY